MAYRHDRMPLSFCLRAGLPLILLSTIAGCTTTTQARDTQMPANGCPAVGWSWVRWNDAYGLNVVGVVQALPGWTFSFSPTAKVLNGSDSQMSAVRIVLIPGPIDPSNPPQTSDQHVYGYWPHPMLGAKPNWVEIQCGQVTFQRFRSTPRDLFNPEPPEPPPTRPPLPPPRGR